MINYQKRLKKVSLFIRYNLVTKNNLKLTKTWKYILVFHCSLSKGADSLEEFVWDREWIFSDRNIAFDYMINYQTWILKNVLVRVRYTNWLLRTTHQKYSSYSLFLIIIKFPYNARFDWLKQRTLSENKVQVNDIKLASKFLLRNFDKFDPN